MMVKSPLDNPCISRIISRSSELACLEDGTSIKLDSFNAESNYTLLMSPDNPNGSSSKWIHILTLVSIGTELASWISKTNWKALLVVDGIHLCPRCKTSEYIRSNKKLNLGVPTCTVCSCSLLNSSLELK